LKSYQNISAAGMDTMGHFITLWMDISPHARNIAIQMIELILSPK